MAKDGNITELPREWKGTIEDIILLLKKEKNNIKSLAVSIDWKVDTEGKPSEDGSPIISTTWTTMTLPILGLMAASLQAQFNLAFWESRYDPV